ERREAVALRERGETIELGVDENDAPAAFNRDIVNIQIAGGVPDARNVEPIASLVHVAGLEGVFESPELIQAAHPKRLAVAGIKAHAAVERALEGGELAVLLDADEKHFPGLIRGESKAGVLLIEPTRQAG